MSHYFVAGWTGISIVWDHHIHYSFEFNKGLGRARVPVFSFKISPEFGRIFFIVILITDGMMKMEVDVSKCFFSNFVSGPLYPNCSQRKGDSLSPN